MKDMSTEHGMKLGFVVGIAVALLLSGRAERASGFRQAPPVEVYVALAATKRKAARLDAVC